MRDSEPRQVRIFISYAHADPLWPLGSLDTLWKWPKEERLNITKWSDKDIVAGSDWDKRIRRALEEMHIFVPLLTPCFASSDYIVNVEVQRALERHEAGEILIVPIVVNDPGGDECERLLQLERLPDKDKSWVDIRKESLDYGGDEAETPIRDGMKKAIDKAWGLPSLKEDMHDPMGEERHHTGGTGGVRIQGNVYGDVIVGGNKEVKKTMGDTYKQNIRTGNITGSAVSFGPESPVSQVIGAQPKGELRDKLEELRKEVEAMAEVLEEHGKHKELGELGENAEYYMKQVTREEPNVKWYQVSAEGLLEAAKFVRELGSECGQAVADTLKAIAGLKGLEWFQ